MANYSDGKFIDRVAGAALTAPNASGLNDQYSIVKQQADSTNPTGRSVIKATSATDPLFGVLNLNMNAVAGDTVEVCPRNAQGTFKVRISANSTGVTIGDELTCSSDSGAITTTTSGNQVLGIAQESGVAGQVIEYLPVNRKQGN